MLIQINTDSNIERDEALPKQAEALLRGTPQRSLEGSSLS
jgi:hypothetical protein